MDANTVTAFRFTRRYAELLLAGIEESQMTEQPHPGMNHPAWIIGHLAIGADFISSLLGHGMATGDEEMAAFGPGSTPSASRADYPSKSELLDLLCRMIDRGIPMAEAATPQQLSQPNETPFFPETFPTVGDLLTHLMTTHAALHLGQLSAWRRAMGLGSVLGI